MAESRGFTYKYCILKQNVDNNNDFYMLFVTAVGSFTCLLDPEFFVCKIHLTSKWKPSQAK